MDTTQKWKVITVGAAITGVGFTGVALADSSTPIADTAQIQQINVDAFEDLSPESADSANESANDSPPPVPTPAPVPAPQPGGGGGDDSSGRGGGGRDDDSASGASIHSF